MFAYSDPTATGVLDASGAIQPYREIVDAWYQRLHDLRDSAFTLLEAFDELEPGTEPIRSLIQWIAFPRTATATGAQIDEQRFEWQDEYVEWWVERNASGSLARVTFTTEFPEYFEALAQVGADLLRGEVANLIPGADPSNRELFGFEGDPDQLSPRTRATRFRQNLVNNPWNNGERGILCLAQRFNTLGALFNLLGHCGVENPNVGQDEVCANVNDFCGPQRNSDPQVCSAAQGLVRANHSLSPSDPCGIRIVELGGIWTVDGRQVDINDPNDNDGVWTVARNGRRGVLDLTRDVRTGGNAPLTGTDVSTVLRVGAEVIAAPDDKLPTWARAGSEMRRIG
jgi:hypothetical protein